MQAFRI